MSTLMASFAQNKFDEIQIHLTHVRGKELLDIRVYSSLSGNDEKIPTGKGLALNKNEFEELKKAIDKTDKLLREKN